MSINIPWCVSKPINSHFRLICCMPIPTCICIFWYIWRFNSIIVGEINEVISYKSKCSTLFHDCVAPNNGPRSYSRLGPQLLDEKIEYGPMTKWFYISTHRRSHNVASTLIRLMPVVDQRTF